MAVRTNSPQITALIISVEKRFGHPVSSRTDFSRLAMDIETVTHEHLAENTLRRIWGNMKGYDTIFKRTVDVLCRYSGFEHWDAFCNHISRQSGTESDVISTGTAIRIEDLKVGDHIRIGWLPDRVCIVEYVGGHTFRALECHNSTLQVGDTFECTLMLKHYPLFVDNLVHGGELCLRYAMGLDNGLTTLEIL